MSGVYEGLDTSDATHKSTIMRATLAMRVVAKSQVVVASHKRSGHKGDVASH